MTNNPSFIHFGCWNQGVCPGNRFEQVLNLINSNISRLTPQFLVVAGDNYYPDKTIESNIKEMGKVGLRAGLVAILGVVIPFLIGTLLGPFFLPGLSFNAYLFLGATLTATSVGITARVFKDLGTLNTPEAKIVLGAAVIDDVLGLIILAVVSAMVTIGAVSFGMVSWILAKAVLFLVGSIILGQLLAPYMSKGFSKINTGVSMKFSIIHNDHISSF